MADSAEEPVEPIKQKTCILKASIHCEGCKRKVKKLLNQVQGVEFVEVDIKQQKVTVTGNVDADTLVRKLVKSGKKAEIWPQKAEKIHGNGKSKEKEIESERKIDREEKTVSDNAKSPETSTKAEVAVKFVEGSGGPVKGDDGGSGGAGARPAKAVNGAPMKAAGGVLETKSEGKKSEENCAAVVEPAPAAEKEAVRESNGGGGTSSKKKKKKGQSGNVASPSGVAPPEQRESRNLEPGPLPPTNHSPPRGHHYPPPHSYYTPPPPTQPAYAVSYNTAYPTSSYTASYYAAPPPYAHAYLHSDPPPSDRYYTPHPPYDPDLNPRQPLDSFEIFSDENPNGCFVM